MENLNKKTEKKIVLIIFGGASKEHAVSLKSAHGVIKNIDRELFDVLMLGIKRDGSFHKYSGDINLIPDGQWEKDPSLKRAFIVKDVKPQLLLMEGDRVYKEDFDIALPVLHGKYGEDGTLQGLLEMYSIPFAGCRTLSSALSMDKYRSHQLVEKEGIRVPKSFSLKRNFLKEELFSKAKNLGYPLMVKPVKGGSSLGITLVEDENSLIFAIKEAFLYDDEVTLEEFIDGFEVGCSIIGNDFLLMGEVDEIELSDSWFDYKEKYSMKKSRIYPRARIDEELKEKIKQQAEVIYRALGCTGFARVDMFLNKNKEVIFNEVNTIPGFTPTSRFPSMMKEVGLSVRGLITRIINLGFEYEKSILGV